MSLYNAAKQDMTAGAFDWVGEAISCLLVSPGYTFNAAHTTVSDVVGSELSGSGYERKVLANRTRSFDAQNRLQHHCDNLQWLGANFGTIGGVITFRPGASDGSRRLINFNDTNDLVTNNSSVTWQVPSTGIIRLDG